MSAARPILDQEQCEQVKQFADWALAATGYRLPEAISEEVVRRTGSGAMSPAIGEALHAVFQRFGEKHGQFLLGFTAFWNGCNYCARSHVLAGNLLHFLDGRLFPVTEQDMVEWAKLPDEKVLAELERCLVGDDADLLALLVRQYELHCGAEPRPDSDDEFIQLALACWSIFNEASIMAFDHPEAFPGLGDPRLADHELLARYRESRS